MKTRIFFILSVIVFSLFRMALAQDNCGTDKLHDRLMQKDSTYRNNFNSIRNQVTNKVQQIKRFNQSAGIPAAPILYTIPVVVHVIHLGEPIGSGTNISDAQIQGAINGVNDRFRNVVGSGVDVQLQFCLASRDPYGCPTNGIVRVNGAGVANYQSGGIDNGGDTSCVAADDQDIKDLSKWPVSDYYNIWVVNDICPYWIAGYAYYPNGNSYDGTIILSNYMVYGQPTLTHELGHGFSLRHTFNGDGGDLYCPVDTNCTINGDYLCDTPPHRQSDCGSSNPCTITGVWNSSRYNYMSYCYPSLVNGRFTSDGKDRMQATMLVSPRASLATSLGCVPHFNATISKTNLACNAVCTGSATASPSCGTSPFTYLWSTGATTQSILNLCAGTYIVTITDATSITASFSVTISTKPDVPSGITSNSPYCDTVLISRGGLIPNGETWYWQGSSCDSTLALGSASIFRATTSGTYYIRAYNNSGNCWSTSCAAVSVLVTNTPPNPTSNSPQCINVTLTRATISQSGESWYWQGSTCGTSTNFGSGSTYSATSSGTYYLRARNNTTGCWSSGCGSVSVVTGTIATPAVPTSNSPRCGSVTITRTGSPPSGQTWYWQSTACDTSKLLGSGTTFTANSSGTYYIRAFSPSGNCWSPACASVTVQVDTVSASVLTPANPTSNSPQCVSATLTRSGSPGAGETWYWQGTNCGISTSLGSSSSFVASASGSYYIRARNASTGCWSPGCGSITVITGSIASPSNPISNGPRCGSVTMTRIGSPPSGQTWYWQSTACDTNKLLGSGTTFTTSSSGTYYIRAFSSSGNCWSPTCGSIAVQVDTVSASLLTPGNPTSNSPQCVSATLTRSGSPIAGETWYWQGTNCGISTSFGSGTTYSASATGNYYIRSRNNSTGCWSQNCGSVMVTVNTQSIAPTGIVAGSNPVCYGDSVSLSVMGGFLGTGAKWRWYANSCNGGSAIDSGAAIKSVLPATTTLYVLARGTCNTTSCVFTTIIVNPQLRLDAGTDSNFCLGETVSLGGSPSAQGGTTPYTYVWLPNTGLNDDSVANPLASPPATTTYTLLVADGQNCLASSSVTLTAPVINGGTGTWTWLGNNSGDWFAPCNWNRKSVPDGQSDVFIPGGNLFQPLVNAGTANCNTLTVDYDNGAMVTVNVDGGAVLNVNH